MQNPEFRREYERFQPKMAMILALIDARKSEAYTQKKLAEIMGTTQSAISRVESGNANPSLDFLQRFADALNLRLKIRFEPR